MSVGASAGVFRCHIITTIESEPPQRSTRNAAPTRAGQTAASAVIACGAGPAQGEAMTQQRRARGKMEERGAMGERRGARAHTARRGGHARNEAESDLRA